MSILAVNIFIDKGFRSRIDEVVSRLKKLGMSVDRVGQTTGIVSGRLTPEAEAAARKVEGVNRVARDREVFIP
jgi:hypothetical protein